MPPGRFPVIGHMVGEHGAYPDRLEAIARHVERGREMSINEWSGPVHPPRSQQRDFFSAAAPSSARLGPAAERTANLAGIANEHADSAGVIRYHAIGRSLRTAEPSSSYQIRGRNLPRLPAERIGKVGGNAAVNAARSSSGASAALRVLRAAERGET